MSDRFQNGQKASDFSAKNQSGNVVSLKDFASQWLVLYFYPKDDTPGCDASARFYAVFPRI
jgi:thioredoxin-dependent peroxiredoxin